MGTIRGLAAEERLGRHLPALAVAALALGAVLPEARAAEILPAVSLHLQAARYAPAERDLAWTGIMGGGADLVRVGRASAYIAGDVETVIGSERRGFDATQANYSLQTGLRVRAGRATVTPFFHHVSRHTSDREKAPAVDWNLLGVRVGAEWGGHRPVRLAGSLGHTTLTSLVGYRWEALLRVDGELASLPSGALYLRLGLRAVTVEPEAPLLRDDFVDLLAEGGFRLRREERVLELFAAFERRNDVRLLEPGALSRLVAGFRVRLAGDRPPAASAPYPERGLQ